MPHVIVKMFPGKTEREKQELADRILKDVMEIMHHGEESVSIAIEEVSSGDWSRKVYDPDIQPNMERLYEKPGYQRF
jgi:4-oxalocrotonate tautomerase